MESKMNIHRIKVKVTRQSRAQDCRICIRTHFRKIFRNMANHNL